MPNSADLCSAGMDAELRHLRVFAAVATHLSYTAANRDLLIAQPAITKTIQQLEAVVGVGCSREPPARCS